jgi:5-formyltetrahydrofolate cyclo-ligase
MQPNLTKPQLRQQLLQLRQSLTPTEWQAKSQQICHQILQTPQFQQAQTILSYCSHRQEADLSPLRSTPDKTWGLPRCVDKTLVWHQWQPHIPLQPSAFGILEPAIDSPILTAIQVDLILVPCIACDRQGYRLGYGGGFYDRLFADPAWQNLPTIGITFDFAYMDQLPIAPWDRPLHIICTETTAQCITANAVGYPKLTTPKLAGPE